MSNIKRKILDGLYFIMFGFTDKALLSKKRCCNVGLYTYMISVLWITFSYIPNVIVHGSLTHDLAGYLGGAFILLLSIILIGSIIADMYGYTKCFDKYERKINCLIYSIMNNILYEKTSIPRYGEKTLVVSFLLSMIIPQVLFIISLIGSNTGHLTIMLLLKGSILGVLSFIMIVLTHFFVSLFWIVTTTSIGFFLWIHSWILNKISNAILMELKGVNTLSLESTLDDILKSDRPALEFLRFRQLLLASTHNLFIFIKRFIFVIFVYFSGFIFMKLYQGERIYLLDMSITMISAVLSSAVIIYVLYYIYRWSTELNRLIIIELKNLRLKAFRENNPDVIKGTEELELITRELGHSLMVRREVWEIVAGIVSLIATLIAILFRYG